MSVRFESDGVTRRKFLSLLRRPIEEKTMPLYVVERDLPGITPDALRSAGSRAKTCCAEI